MSFGLLVYGLGAFLGAIVVVSILLIIGWVIEKIIKGIFRKNSTQTQIENTYFQTYFKSDIGVVLFISALMALGSLMDNLTGKLGVMGFSLILLLVFMIYKGIRR